MLRVTIPNGIPDGIRCRISEVGSQSGESRNSTPLDIFRLFGCLLSSYSRFRSNGYLPAASFGIGLER